MYFSLCVGILCLSLFCYVLLCVHSTFAIVLKRKRTVIALLLLSYQCLVNVNVLDSSSRCCGMTRYAVCDCGIP